MKVFEIIAHPLTLIVSFFFILISGEHFGGFYLLYLLLALPYGGLHALVAMSGIAVLIVAYLKFKRQNQYVIETIMNVLGAACLVVSLIVFFYHDQSNYNLGTFHQVIPKITLAVFGVLVIVFALYNILRTISRKIDDKSMLIV